MYFYCCEYIDMSQRLVLYVYDYLFIRVSIKLKKALSLIFMKLCFIIFAVFALVMSVQVSVQADSVPADSVPINADSVKSCKQYDHLTFGILPFVSNEQLVMQFSPLAQYLTEKLDLPVRIETAPDFAEFAKRSQQGTHYDILFTAPHFYPRANNKAGYRLIASVDSPGMWAVIVAPKKSKIYNLHDLKGKRLATAHPDALSSLLVKKHLRNAGIDPTADLTLVTTPSHDASLLSSYHGVTDASSLMQPPYAAASEQVRQNMRIIARTESTPHIPISVSPRINNDCATEISDLLLTMRSTKEGRKALSHNRFSGFRKAYAQDYERIRDLLTLSPPPLQK
jgi:phosphonate transport system substrate-binding protein